MVLHDVGGSQIVQVHNEVPCASIKHILRLFHEIKVQLFDEAVRQLCGDRAGLRADNQLSGFVLTGEDDIGEADLHTAGTKVNRVQVNLFNAVRYLHL